MADEIANLKLALQCYDIDVEQCMYHECKDWIVMTYSGISGIQCDNCKKYFCEKHGSRTENRDTFPIKLLQICDNCYLNIN